jgi:DNA repair protein RadC
MHDKILIKDIGSHNKPRERLLEKGPEALSDIELLAIVLNSGGKGMSVIDLASRLLKNFTDLQNLFEADIEQLTKEKYVGKSKAATIKAVSEVAKRAYMQYSRSVRTVKNPEQAFNIIKKDLFGKKREYLYLLSLDARKNLLAKDLICIGSVNETLIPVREIVRKALLRNALHIILAHNHPSQDPSPSQEDILVTEKVARACLISGVTMLDHIITAGNDYTSIKSLDLFETKKLEKEGR